MLLVHMKLKRVVPMTNAIIFFVIVGIAICVSRWCMGRVKDDAKH